MACLRRHILSQGYKHILNFVSSKTFGIHYFIFKSLICLQITSSQEQSRNIILSKLLADYPNSYWTLRLSLCWVETKP